jgi:hypothetical protein
MKTQLLANFLNTHNLEICVRYGIIEIHLNVSADLPAYRLISGKISSIGTYHAFLIATLHKGPVQYRKNSGDANTPWKMVESLETLVATENIDCSGLLVLPPANVDIPKGTEVRTA